MTKRERGLIRKAIRLIHSDEDHGGDYIAGMNILAKLAGMGLEHVELLDKVTGVTVQEIASGPNNCSFRVKH